MLIIELRFVDIRTETNLYVMKYNIVKGLRYIEVDNKTIELLVPGIFIHLFLEVYHSLVPFAPFVINIKKRK